MLDESGEAVDTEAIPAQTRPAPDEASKPPARITEAPAEARQPKTGGWTSKSASKTPSKPATAVDGP